MTERQVARDISYASSAQSRGGRALIRALENATGRLRLIRQAEGYQADVARGADFWEVMAARYRLTLDPRGAGVEAIPRSEPLVVIANHPYGILDGLMLGLLLSRARGDFRILANSVFRRAEELNRVLLPISFDGTREAQALNIETRASALRYLAGGGAIGVFPGGTVSTAARPFSQPMDPGWRGFTARLVSRSGATVVPVFFEGHNSRLFQIASHLHSTLRLGLLIKEFRARVGTSVGMVVGDPIPPEVLAPFARDSKRMMDFLRQSTYALSPTPLNSLAYGYEFEERYRDGSARIY